MTMKLKLPVKELEFRGADPTGYGWYGAAGGSRKHKGVDIISLPKEDVTSPIHGTVTKYGYVYKNPKEDKPAMRYVEITSDMYRVWLMYVTLEDGLLGERVFEGDLIGKAQDVSDYWGGSMRNHIHVQVWKFGLLTDPEPLLTY